jgi:serine/threonine protein phosphatase 1
MGQAEVWRTFEKPGRTWVVGAVHGEAERLRQVHDQISRQFRSGDRLIYAGDLMGYGPDVVGALDEMLLFRRALMARFDAGSSDIVILRGAQEEMWRKLLQLHFAPDPVNVLDWMLSRGLKSSLDSYGLSMQTALDAARDGRTALSRWTGHAADAIDGHDGHRPLMTRLLHAAVVADGSMLVVNAGFDRGVALDKQLDSFWWGGADFETLTPEATGYRLVVRGATHGAPGVRFGRSTVTLDGGAGRGGPVCAALFGPEGNAVQVVEA